MLTTRSVIHGQKPIDKENLIVKVCLKCGKSKPFDYYGKDPTKEDGRRNVCKRCTNLQAKEVRKNNPDKVLKIALKKYSIELEEYRDIESRQKNCCGICGRTSSTRLCIDHRHDTGKVRGLLCSSCNKALGLLGDTPEAIYKAYEYLSLNH